MACITRVPPPTGERRLHCRGTVPPQYATSPDLRLEVSFDVKLEQSQADAKANETKSALRELGLDDNVSSK